MVNGEMQLNVLGEMVRAEWFRSAGIRREIEVFSDEFVVMPSHIHGIVGIVDDHNSSDDGGVPLRKAPPDNNPPDHTPPHRVPRSLGSFIAGFKSAATKRINVYHKTPGILIWQHNYYEHIIRDDQSLRRIRQYSAENPTRWDVDRQNPSVIQTEREDPWLG